MKKIIAAKNAGFCMGVKRAVDMVLKLVNESKGPIYTYGPLIHNPQVIEHLAKKGVVVLDKNEVPAKGAVIIRTHGIPPSIYEKFEKSGLQIFDATCPFVKKVQDIIQEYSQKGFVILIIGDKGHAEVDSYLGYSKGKGIVISDIKEAGKVSKKDKVCIVAQTTQDKKVFKKIVDVLRKNNSELKVFDTICNATSKRQEEALSLSNIADAVIVVGGSNSANTLRLVDICRSTGTPTYFIEKANELNPDELKNYETIGITAGASTSKETIQEVVDYVNEKFKIKN